MAEDYVRSEGTISVVSGASTFTGTGTLFGGVDREGAGVWVYPGVGIAPVKVGTVAKADPEGVYANLGPISLVSVYDGPSYTNKSYELVDGPAIASGASQAAVHARFVAHLQQNMGLIGNTADSIVWSLVPANSLFIDNVTRTIYQWRGGVLNVVSVVGTTLNPRGAYAGGTTYAKNDMVETGGYIFVSNINTNLGNAPNTAPASTASWMYYPTTGVGPVLDALGIHQITVSENLPSGGQNGDLWFVVA